MGGHGRTGTAVAALAHLAPAAGFKQVVEPGQCVVEWARKNYSTGAVEIQEQGDYLKGLGACVSKATMADLGGTLQGWRYTYGGEGTKAHDHYHSIVPTPEAEYSNTGHAGSGWWDAAKREQDRKADAQADPEWCAMCGVECLSPGMVSVHEGSGAPYFYCSEECLDHDGDIRDYKGTLTAEEEKETLEWQAEARGERRAMLKVGL